MASMRRDRGIILLVAVLLVAIVAVGPLFQITGNVISRAFVYWHVPGGCAINLTEGWNLVGFACDRGDNSVTTLLSPIEGRYSSIHTYDPSDPADSWKSYNPSLPSWVVQDLSIISLTKGYWLYALDNLSFDYNGSVHSPLDIPLARGWSLISVSSNNDTNLSVSLPASITIIYGFNATNKSWYYYRPSDSSGSLSFVSRMQGYWVNSSEESNWYIYW